MRKLAVDAGFDIVSDAAEWVEAASSQAPLRVWLAIDATDRVVAGLSMGHVARCLARDGVGAAATVPVDTPRASTWLSFDSFAQADTALGRAWALSRTLPQALVSRFWEETQQALANQADPPSTTEREAMVRQRIGQQLFREGLMTLWQGRCAVTGLDVPELLRASHAKPWADSTDEERLDVYNGLLLAAHLDAAFDAGLLGVDDYGRVLLSPQLLGSAAQLLGVADLPQIAIAPAHRPYLEWHRRRVFRAQ
ncbi:MAG: HNH endonuclease [Burkholderiaceae bacterium]|nr:HNH endonuclease [Burkholderiaceae bacterium]